MKSAEKTQRHGVLGNTINSSVLVRVAEFQGKHQKFISEVGNYSEQDLLLGHFFIDSYTFRHLLQADYIISSKTFAMLAEYEKAKGLL